MSGGMERVKRLFATTISTEPVVLFLSLGNGLLYGAGVNTFLLIEKVCKHTLGYDEEICDNLSAEENEDANIEVNEYVNKFNLVGSLMYAVLTFFFNLFIGGFADKHGMKAVLYLTFVGKEFWHMYLGMMYL